MARKKRVDVGGMIYHVYNRANAKAQIFATDEEYADFERLLIEAKRRFPMWILAYCLMPSHWHLVLKSFKDGDLARFVHWLCTTHAKRWHTWHETEGTGHLYQDRFKSIPVEKDEYLLQLLRYVERNPVRAHLVDRAEQWKWSSLWARSNGSSHQKPELHPWPIRKPNNYLTWINTPLEHETFNVDKIRRSTSMNIPYGSTGWAKGFSRIR